MLMLAWICSKRFNEKSNAFLPVLIPVEAGLFGYPESLGIILTPKSFSDLRPWVVYVSGMYSILKLS